ncbi:Uncharacterised protein [uncultured archaeon]|nr:Uncharacterised protein [uncultured archaeon]
MKRLNLILIFLIGFSFFVILAHAADLTNQLDSTVKQVEGTVDTAGKIISNPVVARDELSKAYLKQAWGQILESKPIIGNVIRGYRAVSPYTDPIISFILGMAPTLSWYFLLLFVVWFTLIKYYSTLFEILKDFTVFNDTIIVILLFFFYLALTLLGVFQTISKWISDKVVSIFSLFSEWYVQLIALAVLVVGLIFLGKLSKQIKIISRAIKLKQIKNKKEKEQEERNKRQEKATQRLEKVVETVSKEASSTQSMARARAREESGEAEYERSTSDEL